MRRANRYPILYLFKLCVMKHDAKEVEKNIKLLKSSLKPLHDFMKIQIYWSFLEELMNKNEDNVEWVRDRWNISIIERTKKLEKNIEEKERMIAEGKKKSG